MTHDLGVTEADLPAAVDAMDQAVPLAQDRAGFIGGTDAAVILLGKVFDRTRYSLYREKVGEAEPLRRTPQELARLERGKRLEPYVLSMLAEERGLQVEARDQRAFLEINGTPLSAQLDAVGRLPGEYATVNVEVKTVNPWMADEWAAVEDGADGVPAHYAIQAMHGLMVTGRSLCLVAALIGNDDLRVYPIERDELVIGRLMALEAEFWRCVVRHEPPPPVTLADVDARWRRDTGLSIEASPEIANIVAGLAYERERIAEHQAAADKLEADIKQAMGNAATMTFGGRPLATWKTQKAQRLDQRSLRAHWPGVFAQFQVESESRVFRLKGAKR